MTVYEGCCCRHSLGLEVTSKFSYIKRVTCLTDSLFGAQGMIRLGHLHKIRHATSKTLRRRLITKLGIVCDHYLDTVASYARFSTLFYFTCIPDHNMILISCAQLTSSLLILTRLYENTSFTRTRSEHLSILSRPAYQAQEKSSRIDIVCIECGVALQ